MEEEWEEISGGVIRLPPPSTTRNCAFCLDDFVRGDKIKQLPCKHYFHASCLWQWLSHKRECPICRHPVPAPARKRRPAKVTRDHEILRRETGLQHVDHCDSNVYCVEFRSCWLYMYQCIELFQSLRNGE